MSKKTKSTKVVSKKKTYLQKLQAVKKPYSKAQLLHYIAKNMELSKSKVAEVFELLDNVIKAHLCKNGAGVFNFIGIAKFKIRRVPAQKARKGKNPFTGKEIMLKAKPARNVVKIKPLKKLKDNVA